MKWCRSHVVVFYPWLGHLLLISTRLMHSVFRDLRFFQSSRIYLHEMAVLVMTTAIGSPMAHVMVWTEGRCLSGPAGQCGAGQDHGAVRGVWRAISQFQQQRRRPSGHDGRAVTRPLGGRGAQCIVSSMFHRRPACRPHLQKHGMQLEIRLLWVLFKTRMRVGVSIDCRMTSLHLLGCK